MENLIEEGEVLFAAGEIDKAQNRFEEIIKNNPGSKEALNNLGVIALGRNEITNARSYFQRALKSDPTYRDAIDNLAELGRIKIDSSEITGIDSVKSAGIAGYNIAIVNSFNNKFNQLYSSYFGKNNNIRVVKAGSQKEILDLDPVIEWANIIYTPWANEALFYLSNKKTNNLLITNIRSYEIFFKESIESINWGNVDGIIFVADHVREIANEKWPDLLSSMPQTTIWNCVEIDKYLFYDKMAGKNIAYIGYLNTKKGLELLLQCIKAAVNIDDKYRLHIAGEFQGERFDYYTRHLLHEMGLDHHVVFHGWVDNISEFLKDMHYVVSASPWEGCPNNIIESMACGIKPLIHNWRGAKDIFPESTVFNTVDDFVGLLKSGDYNSAAYRKYVEANFNAAVQLPKIDSFMQSALENRNIEMPIDGNSAKRQKISHPAEDKSDARVDKDNDKENRESINFLQPLPQKVELVNNRKQFTVNFCRCKKVLHIGCVDAGIMEERIKQENFLHHQISRVAEKLIGVDIDEKGIAFLNEAGYDTHVVDIQTDCKRLKELSRDVDIIVIPEVIEHLDNVGQFLDNLRALRFEGDILISTPNAFSHRIAQLLPHGVELVHPNHNYYFSPVTLTTLLDKHGFEIKRYVMYYWPGNDDFGRQFAGRLRKSPYYAEGIIVIARCRSHQTI